MADPAPADGPDPRGRILAAAAALIAAGGPGAATTRAVAAAAGVQAPAIYRLFGTKGGLLDAVARAGIAAYVAGKSVRAPHPDPVEDLRDGWDAHVAFGLAHPGLFAIMTDDPRAPAAAAGIEVLRARVRAIARAGRLRVGEERALALVRAVGTGTVLALLAEPEDARDPGLSAAAREAVLAAIAGPPADTGSADEGPAAAAGALRARLDRAPLSPGERLLLDELLRRVADA